MSKKERKKATGYDKLWRIFKIQIVFLVIIVGAVAYYYVGGYASMVSDMKNEAQSFVKRSSADTFRQTESSILYDTNGTVISVLKGEKDVYYLSFEEIPSYATQALISIEDKKFYKHKGVDYKAIVRALYAMIRNGEVTQGASTITQQLARNMFLTTEKTWQRKIEEIFISVALEEKYSKQEILEFYLNNVYFANGYYGIEAAAKGYFNKEAKKLTLSEICYLIAIPNSPNSYDPVKHPEKTLSRRNKIIENMYSDGIISAKVYREALDENIVLNRPTNTRNNYVETYAYYCATRVLMKQNGFEFKNSFASEREKKEYQKRYDEEYLKYNRELYTGGYRIYTSIDLNKQEMLQEAIDINLQEFTDVNDEGIYKLQSAGVCIDNETGMVNAIVGGRSQDTSGYTLNRAFQSFRQPGSSIKPLIVYTPALERGYEPDTVVCDEKIEDGPENSSKTYSGNITLRQAVMYSKNTIAWKLYEELTPQVGLQYLLDLGYSKIDKNDYGMASCLGGLTNGVSPLEMAKGYFTIYNDGFSKEPDCISKITDSSGNILYEGQQEEISIYKENAARTMTSMLESVIIDGTAKGVSLGDMPCAGKTGTTDNNFDGWFVGYSNYYTTSIWVGYDMPQKVPGLTGSSYPAAIWETYMKVIHEDLEPVSFKLPINFIGIEEQQEDIGLDEEENQEIIDEHEEVTQIISPFGEDEAENLTREDELEDINGIREDEPVRETQTITQTFEGTRIPEGVIPDNAENVTITTTIEE